jgi:hypothetical protein
MTAEQKDAVMGRIKGTIKLEDLKEWFSKCAGTKVQVE